MQPADRTSERRAWMGELAKASCDDLETAWNALSEKPDWQWLRKPETGLVMVRGRAGGTGGAFNLGEMTVTRCALTIDAGTTGYGYVAGRNARHAELAAVFDALLQSPHGPDLKKTLLEPLAETRSKTERRKQAKAAATRVEFFTMVRGED